MPTSDISKMLHQGLEQRDVSTMLGLYDENAEVTLIDKNHTPSRPMIMRGRSSVESYYKDVLTRPLKHHIDDEVMSDNHYAYTDTCEYPDGSKVFSSVMATLKDGKIVKEVELQAWDENA